MYEPPGDAYLSGAFCWAQAFLSCDRCTLAIDGCHWACPYEYRFYDFTEPATLGWPALPIVEASGESVTIDVGSEKPPVWLEDGTFECYETRRVDTADVVVARTRLRRESLRMIVIERWIDEAEAHQREEDARAIGIIDARRERYQAESALYLQVVRFAKEHGLPHDWTGWNQRDGQDVVWIHFRRTEPRASAELSWGVVRGPITVRLYDTDGKHAPDIEHDLSEEGMARALERVCRAFA